MPVRSLEDLRGLEGGRALVRIDLEGFLQTSTVVDDPRLPEIFSTVDWLVERGAAVTLATAWNGESGSASEELASALETLLGRSVEPLAECVGERVARRIAAQRADHVLLLGDLAAAPGETVGDPELALELAAPFSHFVCDAFAVAHLELASACAIAAGFPEGRRAIGRAMQTEVDALACLMNRPERPNVAVLGGRCSDRLFAAAARLIARADSFAAVGELGLAMLAARGFALEVEPRWREAAARLLETMLELQVEPLLPFDLRVGRARRPVMVDRLGARHQPVDIGPATLGRLREALADAETAFWCGETAIAGGTGLNTAASRTLARALGAAPGFSVMAGLDTVAAVGGVRRLKEVSHVVCGGEAALAFIADERLPGLAVMED